MSNHTQIDLNRRRTTILTNNVTLQFVWKSLLAHFQSQRPRYIKFGIFTSSLDNPEIEKWEKMKNYF